ncbi:MAG: phospho-sugar mutase [Clostridia bacterium]|nr:phospho-sugar mutase [Clostridia bacterium]
MDYKQEYQRWLASDKVDEATKNELLALEGNDEEIKFRFISYLAFGTGGLRGTMIAGMNAMNVYTVAHATQGFANLILKEGKADRGVVIAHDSRNNSDLFSRVTAEVFAANGIKVYFFDSLRPTPVLSFAIRYLGTIAGVNVTASHNPKEYNGYKAYWEDGAQLSLEQADLVSSYINATDIFDGVKRMDFDTAVAEGKIEIVGTVIDDAFIQNVTAQLVDKTAIPSIADDLKVVYTPLHGCGHRLVPEVLRLCGLKHLYTVGEQMVIDGNFPTVKSPNPEYPEALSLGVKLAEKVGSDLVLATDPDADRVGIMVRNSENQFVTITGNQVGALLLDYVLTAYENTNTMPEKPYAVKTIVTTELATKICREHGVDLYNVLTGFKFIGEVIKNHDDIGDGNYLLGFEESYGYLKGTYARDKDSVVASMLIVEMAAYYKAKGMTLYDALVNMFDKYGHYIENTVNVTMPGLDGVEKMKALMNDLRKNPPTEIGGKKVVAIRDYQAETITDLITGAVTPTGLPASNVLYFECEGGNVVVVRPSGTEPKIKLYLLVNGACANCCKATLEAFKKTVETWT